MSKDDRNDKITQGQLWLVVKEFASTGQGMAEYGRRTIMEVGEVFEIRYPYGWHVRCEDDKYFHLEPEDILANAKLIGTIYEDVKFDNRAKLEEIIRLKLYKGKVNMNIPVDRDDRADFVKAVTKS